MEIECRPKWLRVTRETQAEREPVFMLAGAEEPGRLGVRASIVAQATPERAGEHRPWPAQRRVTTAGAKGCRKMEAK